MEAAPFRDPGRQKPARGVRIQLGTPNWVWVTLCTEDRQPWLACAEAHELLRQTWSDATRWLVADYILMPDHAHFFAAAHDIGYPFDSWVTYWQRLFRRRHNHLEWRWQPHPFHHRLRHGESYSAKWRYLSENPVRKGLVERPELWPFQGRIHEIAWSGH